MRRGDVVWVELGSPVGSEARGRRPAVVVSNDGANEAAEVLGSGVLTIIPVTTNTRRVQPYQVLLPGEACGLPRDSKAQCEQVRSVDVRRMSAPIGRVPASLADELDEALRLQLWL